MANCKHALKLARAQYSPVFWKSMFVHREPPGPPQRIRCGELVPAGMSPADLRAIPSHICL
jgi:hypothetical protein